MGSVVSWGVLRIYCKWSQIPLWMESINCPKVAAGTSWKWGLWLTHSHCRYLMVAAGSFFDVASFSSSSCQTARETWNSFHGTESFSSWLQHAGRRKNREKEGALFCYSVTVQTESEHHTLNSFNSLQGSTSPNKYLYWLFEIQMSKLIYFFICSF